MKQTSFTICNSVRTSTEILVLIADDKSQFKPAWVDPDKEILLALICNYFLTYQLKHVFWVLKRTVSLRRFF